MSLEQALKDNTDAVKENTATVRELIALLKDGNALPIGAATDKVIETAKKNSTVEGDRVLLGHSGKAPVETAKNYAAPEKEEATERLIDYTTDVVPVFQKLCVAKGRDAGAGILAKWNVTKLSQVPADKLGELLADIQKAAA